MPRINEVQQHRVQVLLKRMKEYHLARIGLVQQLKELDAQAKVVQQEFRALQNSWTPIGCLPEEVLTMVFEAGTHLKHETGLHFAVLVSHVTGSWRNIALATPRLWATIRCAKSEGMGEELYPEAGVERTAAFLARSRSSPIDLHLNNFLDDSKDLHFLELLRNHFVRCQHLSITDVHGGFPLPEALSSLPRQPTPSLESFQFALADNSDILFEFEEPLFPFDVPHLKTAQFEGILLHTFPFCLGALQSITSLSLLYRLDDDDEYNDGYTILRDSLMALPSLIHLELQQYNFVPLLPSRRPVVLPTLKALRYSDHLNVLSMIHAASLTVLILDWNSNMVHACDVHFPSLQHLVLLDFTGIQPNLIILGQFPSIERLTLSMVTDQLHVDDILAALSTGTREAGNNGHHIPFPRLRTLALSASHYRPMDIAKLAAKMPSLQGEGVPIGKLMLPESWLTQTGADLEALVELRKCVEIADFCVDWPTPFTSERFNRP